MQRRKNDPLSAGPCRRRESGYRFAAGGNARRRNWQSRGDRDAPFVRIELQSSPSWQKHSVNQRRPTRPDDCKFNGLSLAMPRLESLTSTSNPPSSRMILTPQVSLASSIRRRSESNSPLILRHLPLSPALSSSLMLHLTTVARNSTMQSCQFFGRSILSTLQPQYFFHFPIPDAVHAFVQIDRRVAVVRPDLDDVANLKHD